MISFSRSSSPSDGRMDRQSGMKSRAQREVKECGKNCATCALMIEGEFVQMENGEIFHFQETLTHHSKNVVYAMFCAGCDATYFKETDQPFTKFSPNTY